jgi:hypothetical protein
MEQSTTIQLLQLSQFTCGTENKKTMIDKEKLIEERNQLEAKLALVDNELNKLSEQEEIESLNNAVGKCYVEIINEDIDYPSYYFVHTINKKDLSLLALRISKFEENDYLISTRECLVSVNDNDLVEYKEIPKEQFQQILDDAVKSIKNIIKTI